MDTSFWDIVWFIVISFAFVAYLLVLFQIFGDLFQDRNLSGLAKGVWVVVLVIFPLITALIYLIARGGGMAQRSLEQVAELQQNQQRLAAASVPTASPADEIGRAKALLDAGALSQEEFDALKRKALA